MSATLLPSEVRLLSEDGATTYAIIESGGYELVLCEAVGRQWNRQVVTSPFVDGNRQVRATLAAAELVVAVRIKGSSWAQVRGRERALVTAASYDDLLVRTIVDGVTETWAANAADVDVSFDPSAARARQTSVVLRFPVQPTSTLSGTVV